MTTNPPPVYVHSRRSWWWLVVPAGLVSMVVLLAVGITGFFRLGRDAQCLRDSVAPPSAFQSGALKKKIQLSVGPFSCLAFRTGFSFFPIDPDVRTALRAVRGAEVGVYHWPPGVERTDHSIVLERADRAMNRRGWDRVVGVAREHELIAVYVPQRSSGPVNLQVCLAVLNRDDLVIVSARSHLEPLMELARKRTEGKELSWLTSSL